MPLSTPTPKTIRSLCSLALLACASLLTACQTAGIIETGPSLPLFLPEKYFAGRSTSRGMIETRAGRPRAAFTVVNAGRRSGSDVELRQAFRYGDGQTQERVWQMRRVAEGRYEATGNDLIGVAHGETLGSVFHLRYTVALQPGNPFSGVDVEQWMRLQPDQLTVSNRGILRKLGVRVGTLTETIEKAQ